MNMDPRPLNRLGSSVYLRIAQSQGTISNDISFHGEHT